MSKYYNVSPVSFASSVKRACFKCPSSTFRSDSNILTSGGNSNSKSIFASQGSQASSLNTPKANIKKISGKSASLSTVNSGLVDTDVLSTSEIDGFKLLSDADFNGVEIKNINITSGMINNTSIGLVEPDEGHFTNLVSYDDLTVSGNLIVNNKIIFDNNPYVYMENQNNTLLISTTGTLSLSASSISNLNTSGPLYIYDKLYFKSNDVFFDQSNSGLLTLSTTGAINISSNDITTNEFLEQQWQSYNDFNFLNYQGTALIKINKELDGSNNNHFFLQSNNNNTGKFYLSSDITQIVRNQLNRGMKLTGIYINYQISGNDLNSIFCKINQYSINNLGIRTSNTITSFSLNTIINTYYTYNIISSSYLSLNNYLSVEIDIDKMITTNFKFYGVMLEFNKRFF